MAEARGHGFCKRNCAAAEPKPPAGPDWEHSRKMSRDDQARAARNVRRRTSQTIAVAGKIRMSQGTTATNATVAFIRNSPRLSVDA